MIKKMSKKKMIIIAVSLLLVIAIIVGVVVATTPKTSQTFGGQDSKLYLEEKVEKGNIVVGVSESTSATLITTDVAVENSMEVLQVLVSTGQYVNEGEVIATVSLDDYQGSSDDNATAISEAQKELQELTIQSQSKLISAKQTYDKSIQNGKNAQTLYNLDIDEIDNGLTLIDEEIENLNEDIADTQNQIDNGLTDDFGVSEAKSEIADLETTIESLNVKIDETEDNQTLIMLQEELNKATEQLANLNTELEKANAQYNTAYDKLSIELENLKSQLSSKTTARTKYLATMESSKIQAKAEYDLAIVEYNNAQTVYDSAVEEINEQLEVAQEKIDDLEETTDEQEQTLVFDQEGNVYAPCNGYIMEVTKIDSSVVSNNNMNNSSASPLTISIADSSYVELSVSITQDDIADVEVGMDVNVTFDAYEGVTLPGYVDRIEITTSSGISASVSYTVTIACNVPSTTNDGEVMKVYHGMTANATFVLKQVQDVLVVSSKCILSDNGSEYVKLLKDDGSIEQVQVTTGFSDGFDVEILQGLNEGDIVIIESAVMANAY